MSFKFSLATVLRIRISLEEREERLLGQIVHELGQNALSMERTASQIADSVGQRETGLRAVSSASQLHQACGQIEELRLHATELEIRQKKLGRLRLEQIRIYEIAHRNRKMLSDLYDERQEVYEAVQARLEQKVIDDGFNARRRQRAMNVK